MSKKTFPGVLPYSLTVGANDIFTDTEIREIIYHFNKKNLKNPITYVSMEFFTDVYNRMSDIEVISKNELLDQIAEEVNLNYYFDLTLISKKTDLCHGHSHFGRPSMQVNDISLNYMSRSPNMKKTFIETIFSQIWPLVVFLDGLDSRKVRGVSAMEKTLNIFSILGAKGNKRGMSIDSSAFPLSFNNPNEKAEDAGSSVDDYYRSLLIMESGDKSITSEFDHSNFEHQQILAMSENIELSGITGKINTPSPKRGQGNIKKSDFITNMNEIPRMTTRSRAIETVSNRMSLLRAVKGQMTVNAKFSQSERDLTILLIDQSSSMRHFNKVILCKAILVERLKAAFTKNEEVLFMYYTKSLNIIEHVNDNATASKMLKYILSKKYTLYPEITRIQSCLEKAVNYVDKNLDISSYGRMSLSIIMDGEDPFSYKTAMEAYTKLMRKYKITCFQLNQTNEELSKFCEETGGATFESLNARNYIAKLSAKASTMM